MCQKATSHLYPGRGEAAQHSKLLSTETSGERRVIKNQGGGSGFPPHHDGMVKFLHAKITLPH